MAVHPHGACLQPVSIFQRLTDVLRPDAGRQAIFGVVGQLKRLFCIGYAHQVDDRAKHLFAGQPQRGIRVHHQRRRYVIPFAIRAAVAGDQLCVACRRLIQEGLHLVAVRTRHQRVDKRLRRHARADAQGFHRLLKPAHQRVKQRRFNVDTRACRADLPLIQEATGHQAFDHPRRVRIFQHDCRVFAAQLQGNARQRIRRRARNLFSRRGRAGETHFRNMRMRG